MTCMSKVIFLFLIYKGSKNDYITFGTCCKLESFCKSSRLYSKRENNGIYWIILPRKHDDTYKVRRKLCTPRLLPLHVVWMSFTEDHKYLRQVSKFCLSGICLRAKTWNINFPMDATNLRLHCNLQSCIWRK